jgi:hypothetical protein
LKLEGSVKVMLREPVTSNPAVARVCHIITQGSTLDPPCAARTERGHLRSATTGVGMHAYVRKCRWTVGSQLHSHSSCCTPAASTARHQTILPTRKVTRRNAIMKLHEKNLRICRRWRCYRQ